MIGFALLLCVVLGVLFYPGVTNQIRLSVFVAILIAIVLYLGYMSYKSLKSSKSSKSDTPCNSCNGPRPKRCSECGHNPCKCSHILPGQTECPKCRGSLGGTSVPSIQGCGSCGRHYRCPGCLL